MSNEPRWLMSPAGKVVGVACGEERVMRHDASFREFCENATYFLLAKLPRETVEENDSENNEAQDHIKP